VNSRFRETGRRLASASAIEYRNVVACVYFYLVERPYSIWLYRGSPVPLRQRHIWRLQQEILELLRLVGIDFCLVDGSLLGAIRSGGFAGRPKDIDVAVPIDQAAALREALTQLAARRSIMVIDKSAARFAFWCLRKRAWSPSMRFGVVDIRLVDQRGVRWSWPRPAKTREGYRYGGELDIDWKTPDVYAQVFGSWYRIPSNYPEYLSYTYGSDWMLPRGRQVRQRRRFPQSPSIRTKSVEMGVSWSSCSER